MEDPPVLITRNEVNWRFLASDSCPSFSVIMKHCEATIYRDHIRGAADRDGAVCTIGAGPGTETRPTVSRFRFPPFMKTTT
jgi:hypothetical protein